VNTQPIEKARLNDGNHLEVHSVFNTIQGEGPFTGRQAVFVRLAGCNLQCPACDTDYTTDRWNSTPFSILQFVQEMKQAPALVVITGGEPFRQNIHPLVELLLLEGYTVQIETNGTLPPPTVGFLELCSLNTSETNKCFVVCSPKAGKVNPVTATIVCAYKYVMAHDSVAEDGLPLLALGHSASPHVARPHQGFKGAIYLQPCDDKDDAVNSANLRACMNSVMLHPYALQLQVHKLIGAE
jgi:organic radical activating enzyme